MAIASNIGIVKIAGVFGMIILLIFWFGGAGLGAIKSAKSGDWSGLLSETGGRLFSVDSTLNDETDFLLDPNNKDTYLNIFHLVYALSLIFLLFIMVFAIFKFFNWLVGIEQFSPTTDIMIIVIIGIILIGLQFAYSYFILDKFTIPFSGIFRFLKNFPGIIN